MKLHEVNAMAVMLLQAHDWQHLTRFQQEQRITRVCVQALTDGILEGLEIAAKLSCCFCRGNAMSFSDTPTLTTRSGWLHFSTSRSETKDCDAGSIHSEIAKRKGTDVKQAT